MARNKRMGLELEARATTEVYKKKRNRYVAASRKTKPQSWKNFVTTESGKDPWSIPYKIIRDKIKRPEAARSVMEACGELTTTWLDSIQTIPQKCAPKDDLLGETEDHRNITSENEQYINCNIELPISMQEIDAAISKAKNNKALDRIILNMK